jgi:hypothetical protein
MSLTSMVLGTEGTTALRGGAGPVPQPVATFVTSVVVFIPSEVLTIYVSAEAAIRGAAGTPSTKSTDANDKSADTSKPAASPTSTAFPSPAATVSRHVSAGTGTVSQPKQDIASYPTWAHRDAGIAFGVCIAFIIVWVIGLQFLDFNRKQNAAPPGAPKPTFVFPYWKVTAGIIGFYVYALGVDTIWINPPSADPSHSIGASLLVIFIAPILVFANSMVAALWPEQAVSS